MPEMSKTPLTIQEDIQSAAAKAAFCTGKYALYGPQVEPEASYWLECPAPRVITLDELIARTQDKAQYPDFFMEKYPTDALTLKAEIEELIQLARLRDEPGAIPHETAKPITDEPQQPRQPLSMFLQLRPQPLGAVINTARGDAFPVIATGRELSRYFESETPGLQFQLALDYMIREKSGWSPPRQARVWAALNVAIFSALQAAWFYKWWAVDKNRKPIPGIADRPRPWECYKELDVLFDRIPNATNSADAETRGFPMGVQPLAPKPGVQVPPEMQVPDILKTKPSQPTPGTPRHPAYPSGHSTYSAAAAATLCYFFPVYSEQLTRLADNTGLARLWAGVHWRSDHRFGQRLGRAVASLIVEQLEKTHIGVEPALPPAEEPKTVDQIAKEAVDFKDHCGKG
ncbi:MAG TPA: phosphatase PAP2 family protein [Thermoanaerobaculia bacterium]|nr:phosphatase PAP2 family protein [Thermoanaerobaculia bacterium]